MASVLTVTEGIQQQHSGETIAWGIDCAARGTPTSPTAVVTNSAGTDVTSTVMPSGSISIATTVITLKPLTALTAGEHYQIAVTFTVNTNISVVTINIRCPE